jgi:hypothetical protein
VVSLLAAHLACVHMRDSSGSLGESGGSWSWIVAPPPAIKLVYPPPPPLPIRIDLHMMMLNYIRRWRSWRLYRKQHWACSAAAIKYRETLARDYYDQYDSVTGKPLRDR